MAGHGRLPIRTESDLQDLLKDFEQHLRKRNLAEKTVSTQLGGAKQFADYLTGKMRAPKK